MDEVHRSSSTFSRLESIRKGGGEEENQGTSRGASDLLSKETSFQDAIFGVLFTLGKEKFTDSAKVAFTNVILDFMQILLFIVNTQYPWEIPWDNPLLKWVKQINLRNPLVGFGYSSFSIFFYLLAACLFLSIGLCAYVAYNFKTDNFPYVWPIKFLRLFVSVFLDSFYISLLNIYLIGPNCGIRVNPGMSWAFPDVKCFTVPHIFMFIVGIVCATLASIMSFLLVISSSEGNILTTGLTYSSHSSTEVRLWFGKTVITVVAALAPNYPKALAIFFFIMCSYLWWNLLRRAPYYSDFSNCLKFALYSVLAWASLMLVILQHDLAANRRGLTIAMAVGSIAALILGWLLMKWRLYMAHTQAVTFYNVQLVGEKKAKAWFIDPFEVEVVARCCRLRNDIGNLSDKWIDASESVIRAGVQKFPDSAFLCLLYANFLLTVRRKPQAASSQLARARKARSTTISERFSIFVADRERKQRTGDEHGGEAMDLVSYVEFQNTYKQLMQNHIASLKTVRGFWRELLKANVTFSGLCKLFGMMDDSEQKAERSYKMLLERYPKSFKLLRSYGRFLEDVKGDPYGASRYFREADRLESQESSDIAKMVDLQGMDASSLGELADAVVVTTDAGIITFVNGKLLKMFGFKKGGMRFVRASPDEGWAKISSQLSELEGKNVSCLMPNPFASHHDGFIRNYNLTGRSSMLNTSRVLVGLHKQRYVFPVGLTVTKTNQMDVGTVFVGAFQTIEDEVSKASVFLTSAGLVLAANRGFLDMFGYSQTDLQGKNIRFIAAYPDILERELRTVSDLLDKTERVSRTQQSGHDDSDGDDIEPPKPVYGYADSPLGKEVYSFECAVRHKYGTDKPFQVRVSVSLAGTSSIRIPVLTMVQLEASQGVVAMDSHGNITYCSASIETMLGYKIGALGGGFVELSRILPSPYASLHHKMVQDWQRYADSTGDTTRRATSCSSGRVVSFQAKSGALKPCKLSMSLKTDPDSRRPLYAASIMQVPNTSVWAGAEGQGNPEDLFCSTSRLRLLCSMDGTILGTDAPGVESMYTSVNGAASPAALFGHYRNDMQDMHLTTLVDAFEEALTKARMFNPGVKPERVVPPFVQAMLEHLDEGLLSYLVGVALGGQASGYAAAFMVVQTCSRESLDLDSLLSQGVFVAEEDDIVCQSEFLMVDLYDAEKLQGTIDIDKADGTVRRCDRQAAILLGHQQDVIQGRLINELVANPIPLNKISTSLGLRLGKDIGERTSLQVLATDGTSYRAECLFSARSRNDGVHLQGLISVPRSAPSDDPITSFSKLQDILQSRLNPAGSNAVSAAPGQRSGRRGSVSFASTNPNDADEESTQSSMDGSGRQSHRTSRMSIAQPDDTTYFSALPPRDSARSMLPTPDASYKGGMLKGITFRAVSAPDEADGIPREGTSSGKGALPVRQGAESDREDAFADLDADERHVMRARLFRKVKRLLATSKARKSIDLFKRDSLIIISLILIAHVAIFIAILLLTQKEANNLRSLLDPPVILQDLQNIGADIRTGFAGTSFGMLLFGDRLVPKGQLSNITSIYYTIDNSTASQTSSRLISSLNQFDLRLNSLYQHYIETYADSKKAYQVLSTHQVGALVYYLPEPGVPGSPNNTGFFTDELLTPWDLAREVNRHSRVVAAYMRSSSLDLDVETSARFIDDNLGDLLYHEMKDAVTAKSAVSVLQSGIKYAQTALAIIAVELVVVVTFAVFFIWRSARRVQLYRVQLFSIFLLVPRPLLTHLSTKEIRVNEDDSDDDADDDLDFEASKLNPQKDGQESGSSVARVEIAKKDRQLKSSGANGLKYAVVVIALAFAILFSFNMTVAVSVYSANKPVLELEKAGTLFQLVTRIRMLSVHVIFALDMFMLAQGRYLLREATNEAQALYEEATMTGKDGRSLLDNPACKKILFEHACLRHDMDSCLPESSQFYDATNAGLQAAWLKYIQSALHIADTPEEDLTIYDESFQYVQMAGKHDVSDGVWSLLKLLYKDAVQHTDPIMTANGIALAVFILTCVGAYICFRPYVRQLESECNRVAELLSLLPQGKMDVEGLVKASGLLQTGDDEEKEQPSKTNSNEGQGQGPKTKWWKPNKVADSFPPGTLPDTFPGFRVNPQSYSNGPGVSGGNIISHGALANWQHMHINMQQGPGSGGRWGG